MGNIQQSGVRSYETNTGQEKPITEPKMGLIKWPRLTKIEIIPPKV